MAWLEPQHFAVGSRCFPKFVQTLVCCGLQGKGVYVVGFYLQRFGETFQGLLKELPVEQQEPAIGPENVGAGKPPYSGVLRNRTRVAVLTLTECPAKLIP